MDFVFPMKNLKTLNPIKLFDYFLYGRKNKQKRKTKKTRNNKLIQRRSLDEQPALDWNFLRRHRFAFTLNRWLCATESVAT